MNTLQSVQYSITSPPCYSSRAFQRILTRAKEHMACCSLFGKSQCDKQNKASQHTCPANRYDVCTSIYCVHTRNMKKIHSNLNNLNTFTKKNRFPECEISFNKVKLPKVGSNAIVPVGAGPKQTNHLQTLNPKPPSNPKF